MLELADDAVPEARRGTQSRIDGKSSYELADFKHWSRSLGVETQGDGGKLMVVTNSPWSVALRLQPAASGKDRGAMRRR